MKRDTHPEWHPNATITCACGRTYTVGSTVTAMHVEICAGCHPFYTGTAKLVDTARRVDRFKKLLSKRERLGTRAAPAEKRAR